MESECGIRRLSRGRATPRKEHVPAVLRRPHGGDAGMEPSASSVHFSARNRHIVLLCSDGRAVPCCGNGGVQCCFPALEPGATYITNGIIQDDLKAQFDVERRGDDGEAVARHLLTGDAFAT